MPIVTPNVSRLRSRPAEEYSQLDLKEPAQYPSVSPEDVDPERLAVHVVYPTREAYAYEYAYFNPPDGGALGGAIDNFLTPKSGAAAASAPSMSVKDEQPARSGNFTAVFARDGRRVPISVRGHRLTRLDDQHFLSATYSPERGRPYLRMIWRMEPPLAADLQALIEALPKDEYETTAAYEQRLAQTVASASGEVELEGYDADPQLQRLGIAGLTYEASVPLESARQFRGLKSVGIAGKVRAVSPEVLEFLSVEISAAGKTSVALHDLRLRAPATPAAAPAPAPGL